MAVAYQLVGPRLLLAHGKPEAGRGLREGVARTTGEPQDVSRGVPGWLQEDLGTASRYMDRCFLMSEACVLRRNRHNRNRHHPPGASKMPGSTAASRHTEKLQIHLHHNVVSNVCVGGCSEQ